MSRDIERPGTWGQRAPETGLKGRVANSMESREPSWAIVLIYYSFIYLTNIYRVLDASHWLGASNSKMNNT